MGHSQMIHAQIGRESVGTEDRLPDNIESREMSGKFVWLVALLAGAVAIAFAPRPARALAKQARLPYATIVRPQFIPASQATFMSPNDLLIGVTDDKTAKAYPAAILVQHGVVQDQLANGPIAVTW